MVQEQNTEQKMQDSNAEVVNAAQTSEKAAEEVQNNSAETETLKAEVAELKDKYLRIYSEFDNFRKRTSKEKLDFFKTANEDLMSSLLPVLDDFERAYKSLTTSTESKNNEAIAEGINLIYNKLFKTLEVKGLKSMDASAGIGFNSELHEAITQSPAPNDDLKGKVIDVVEKGYYLNDKVIRFAKVIIGS